VTPAARNRLIAVGALLFAGVGIVAVAWGSLGRNLVYYWTPGEMLAQGPAAYHGTIRLGGVVKAGSLKWESGQSHLEFRVADSHAPDAKNVLVQASETPPQMFRENIGVVVEGTFGATGVFHSDRLMVKHSNEYRAPKQGEVPDKKAVMRTMEDGTSK
jgi:cytochrome c-type biogenesis protein CcmE